MRNVIFDIGNVIVRWQPYNALSHLFSDEAEMKETLHQIGFFEWNAEQDRGISWPDSLAQIEKTTPAHAHIFHAYANGLEAAHNELIVGTSEVIEELHTKGVRLFGLTNAAQESFGYMKQTAPILSLLRHITVSAEVGMIKPEAGIFEHCLTQNGLDRTETLFIDDSKANCEGAETVGIMTHQFTTAVKLASELKRLELL